MDNERCIYIILAVFNGELYIEEQINSIIAQSYKNWKLIIRDDGSSDSTLSIIKKLSTLDGRIQIIHDKRNNLGAVRNFGFLLEQAIRYDAEYVAFCDQDDIWQKDKLSLQIEKMLLLEKSNNSENTPVLIFSDLTVVDNKLELLNSSFMDFQGVRKPQKLSLNNLLFQNIVVGNTILINRALLKIASPLPSEIHMHDWWTALCAAAFGEIHFLPVPTVKYRLHGENQVGAADVGSAYPVNLAWWKRLKKMNNLFVKSFVQAKCIQTLLKNKIRDENKIFYISNLEIIECHLKLLSSNPISRLIQFVRTKHKGKTRIVNVLFALQLLSPGLVKKAIIRDCSHDAF